jgi:hypothetical protein
MCSLYLTQYAIMFIELCFNFMSIFLSNYPSCGQLLFCLSCAILSHASLLEVHVTYLGPLVIFLAQCLVLSNGCSLKKLMLNGGV